MTYTIPFLSYSILPMPCFIGKATHSLSSTALSNPVPLSLHPTPLKPLAIIQAALIQSLTPTP